MLWQKDNFKVTDDLNSLDQDFVISSLQRTYWAEKRLPETIKKSLQNSTNFSLFDDGRQIGYARLISDWATYAYLCDVYVLPEYRGKDLGKWLVKCVLEHPAAKVDIIVLATRDAHKFYEHFGFVQDENAVKIFMCKRMDGGVLDLCLGKQDKS